MLPQKKKKTSKWKKIFLMLLTYAYGWSSREKSRLVLNSKVSLKHWSCFHGKLTHSVLPRIWTVASCSDKVEKTMPQQRFFCLYFDKCWCNYFVWGQLSLDILHSRWSGGTGAWKTSSDSASGLAFLVTSPAAGHGAQNQHHVSLTSSFLMLSVFCEH